MTRKIYEVTTEARRYQIELTDAEREQVIRHYHGFANVVEVAVLDFDAIAQELHEVPR